MLRQKKYFRPEAVSYSPIYNVVDACCKNFEIGFFYALVWYWSGFKWSSLGDETCGMEFIAILLLTYPAFILGLLIRFGLLFRWKFPHYVWYLPLIMCGIAYCAFAKSLEMGIFCIISMFALPVVDFAGIKHALRLTQ